MEWVEAEAEAEVQVRWKIVSCPWWLWWMGLVERKRGSKVGKLQEFYRARVTITIKRPNYRIGKFATNERTQQQQERPSGKTLIGQQSLMVTPRCLLRRKLPCHQTLVVTRS